jgi:elongation factor Tu
MEFDSYNDGDGKSRMVIEDVFLIKGRGTVVTGKVASGTFSVGQKVIIQVPSNPITTTITGIETFHKTENFVAAGTSAGLMLENVDRNAVKHGDIIESV